MEATRRNHPFPHVVLRITEGPRTGTWEIRPAWAVRRVSDDDADSYQLAVDSAELRKMLGAPAARHIYRLLSSSRLSERIPPEDASRP